MMITLATMPNNANAAEEFGLTLLAGWIKSCLMNNSNGNFLNTRQLGNHVLKSII